MKNVHLIPTDKPSRLILQGSELLLSKYKEKNEGFSEFNQHIYITSDEEIKEGDWMYYKHFGEDIICKYDTLGGQNTNVNEHKDYYKKIILTTDQDLIKELEQIDQNNTVTRGSTALVYKQGVQAIDDEFLEWFVKNPSCEEVDTIIEYKDGYGNWFKYDKEFWDKMGNKPKFGTRYKIIIPKEEPTISEEAKERAKNYMSLKGALEPKQIKCYCGHTTYCDCSPLEEPKKETFEEAALNIIPDKSTAGWIDSFSATERIGFIKGAKWQQEQDKNKYSEEEVFKIIDRVFHMYASSYRQDAKEWFEQFKKK